MYTLYMYIWDHKLNNTPCDINCIVFAVLAQILRVFKLKQVLGSTAHDFDKY